MVGSYAKGPSRNNLLEEDKYEEDEAEWHLNHGVQAQMPAVMQTHSLAALEDAAPGLIALAGDRRDGKSPHAYPCYPLAWVVSMGLLQATLQERPSPQSRVDDGAS